MLLSFKKYDKMKEYNLLDKSDYVKVQILFKYEDFVLLDKLRKLHKEVVKNGIIITFEDFILSLLDILLEEKEKEWKNLLKKLQMTGLNQLKKSGD